MGSRDTCVKNFNLLYIKGLTKDPLIFFSKYAIIIEYYENMDVRVISERSTINVVSGEGRCALWFARGGPDDEYRDYTRSTANLLYARNYV